MASSQLDGTKAEEAHEARAWFSQGCSTLSDFPSRQPILILALSASLHLSLISRPLGPHPQPLHRRPSPRALVSLGNVFLPRACSFPHCCRSFEIFLCFWSQGRVLHSHMYLLIWRLLCKRVAHVGAKLRRADDGSHRSRGPAIPNPRGCQLRPASELARNY